MQPLRAELETPGETQYILHQIVLHDTLLLGHLPWQRVPFLFDVILGSNLLRGRVDIGCGLRVVGGGGGSGEEVRGGVGRGNEPI